MAESVFINHHNLCSVLHFTLPCCTLHGCTCMNQKSRCLRRPAAVIVLLIWGVLCRLNLKHVCCFMPLLHQPTNDQISYIHSCLMLSSSSGGNKSFLIRFVGSTCSSSCWHLIDWLTLIICRGYWFTEYGQRWPLLLQTEKKRAYCITA